MKEYALASLLVLFAVFCGLLIASDCMQTYYQEPSEVSGSIVFVRESATFSNPACTAIRQDDGSVVRVHGVFGAVGDDVTVSGRIVR